VCQWGTVRLLLRALRMKAPGDFAGACEALFVLAGAAKPETTITIAELPLISFGASRAQIPNRVCVLGETSTLVETPSRRLSRSA
jgi:hypothetical protein